MADFYSLMHREAGPIATFTTPPRVALGSQTFVQAPNSILLEADPGAFDRRVNEFIASDPRLLLQELEGLPKLVADMRGTEDERFDVDIPLANAAASAGTALQFASVRRGVFEIALDALLDAYRLGDLNAERPDDDDARLFEGVVASLWALGACAVERREWAAVRAIVAKEPIEGGYWTSWLRHGQVMAARTSGGRDDDNILDVAVRRLERHPGFWMTRHRREHQLRAAATFDHLAYFVVASLNPEKSTNFYTSFAKYPAELVEHSAIALRGDDEELRDQIFPGPDANLRSEMREANELALVQAAVQRAARKDWQYGGYRDARTWVFIREGHRWEDWR